ncbi:MAG: recombination-associated protein RdgC [Pseudobacteriovorax sp.]|nr:recombination-associated protein RdgC [Pseudobacteriovorax sp.]
MTIFNGSFSVSRYRVLGKQAGISLAAANKKLKTYQARPLKIKGSKELVFGWERPNLGHEFEGSHWDLSDCQWDDGYLLRIRVEKRKVPKSLLQIVFQEKLDAHIAENDGKPLGRNRRKELLDETRDELMDQALPQIGYCDVFWDLEAQEVLLFSTSKGLQAIFEELFRKTFGEHLELNIVKIGPPLLGLSSEEWQINLSSPVFERMNSALPSELAGANIS